MITRDHMDLGCSICTLGSVGAAHIFHTHNAVNPIPAPDDRGTPYIRWPNFHSGANGDLQRVEPEPPVHPVMRDTESENGTVMYSRSIEKRPICQSFSVGSIVVCNRMSIGLFRY